MLKWGFVATIATTFFSVLAVSQTSPASPPGFYNVADAGVDCTGHNPGDAIIQGLINGMPSTGGTIYVPANCAVLFAPGHGVSTGDKPVRFVGQGRNSRIAGTGTAIISLSSFSGTGIEDLTITDSVQGGSLATIAVNIVGPPLSPCPAQPTNYVANWHIWNSFIEQNTPPAIGVNGIGVQGTFALKGSIYGTSIQGWSAGMQFLAGCGNSNANHISGSVIRGNGTGIYIPVRCCVDDLFLTGDTLEGNGTGISINNGTITVVATHFENNGTLPPNPPGGANVIMAYGGSYQSFGNQYCCSTQFGSIELLGTSTGTANSYSDTFVGGVGVTNVGLGHLNLINPIPVPASYGSGVITSLDMTNSVLNGNLTVNGTLSKSAGAFKIDHPLDPQHQYLLHSFVESPDMMDVYNGIATLDAKGSSLVKLPRYFEALNRDFRYQVTPMGAFAPVYVAHTIRNNSFTISGGKPGMKVSWQVTGIRRDSYANAHRIKVEEHKPEEPNPKH